jgi:hypothetical protein
MEIWIPKSGDSPEPELIEAVWKAWRRDSPKDECIAKLKEEEIVPRVYYKTNGAG